MFIYLHLWQVRGIFRLCVGELDIIPIRIITIRSGAWCDNEIQICLIWSLDVDGGATWWLPESSVCFSRPQICTTATRVAFLRRPPATVALPRQPPSVMIALSLQGTTIVVVAIFPSLSHLSLSPSLWGSNHQDRGDHYSNGHLRKWQPLMVAVLAVWLLQFLHLRFLIFAFFGFIIEFFILSSILSKLSALTWWDLSCKLKECLISSYSVILQFVYSRTNGTLSILFFYVSCQKRVLVLYLKIGVAN